VEAHPEEASDASLQGCPRRRMHGWRGGGGGGGYEEAQEEDSWSAGVGVRGRELEQGAQVGGSNHPQWQAPEPRTWAASIMSVRRREPSTQRHASCGARMRTGTMQARKASVARELSHRGRRDEEGTQRKHAREMQPVGLNKVSDEAVVGRLYNADWATHYHALYNMQIVFCDSRGSRLQLARALRHGIGQCVAIRFAIAIAIATTARRV
jgi:hypothetical protein